LFLRQADRFSNTCFCATAPAASPQISPVSPSWGVDGFGAGVTTEIEDVLLTQNAILFTIMKRCKSHTTQKNINIIGYD
jgi:hypothetical protein